MLDPIIARVLKAAGCNPVRIVLGTAALALLAHLDGSGAVTFLVTIPVMLPLYERLGMDKRVLACAASLAAGVNFLPWTGPMIRASASLHLSVASIFTPLIPVQAAGLLFVFWSAWWMGRREGLRLGAQLGSAGSEGPIHSQVLTKEQMALRRPQRFWINVSLTILLIAAMIGARLDPVAAFMVGVVAALGINYPDLALQRERIDAHAKAALMRAARDGESRHGNIARRRGEALPFRFGSALDAA
jgi:CitMHS family citrate-Mg2+:H+ or citrate-Ca2+:H+ symporter